MTFVDAENSPSPYQIDRGVCSPGNSRYTLPTKIFYKHRKRFIRRKEYLISPAGDVNRIISEIQVRSGELTKHDIQLLGCGAIIEGSDPETNSPVQTLIITPFPKNNSPLYNR